MPCVRLHGVRFVSQVCEEDRHMWKQKTDAGQALVVVAFGMVILLSFLGLGIDLGYLRLMKRRVQMVADAAGIAAAAELSYCGSTHNCNALTAAAQDALTENGFTSSTLVKQCAASSGNLTITVNNPPCSLGASDPHNGDAGYVEVVVSQVEPLMFAKVFGVSTATMTARSEAARGSTSNCLYALDPTMSDALAATGGSTLNLPACSMFIDSSSSTAVEAKGSGHIIASSIRIVGNYRASGGGTISPTPTVGVASSSDPLAYIPEPSFTPCVSATSVLAIGGTTHQTLSPGNYCGGITIGNSAVVTFSAGNYVVAKGIQISGSGIVTFGAGMYVMQGGGFSVGNSGQATGSGVTFFLTGTATFPYAPASFTGATTSQLTAPTSGTYVGILFYQDSSANGATLPTAGNTSNFVGSASTYFQGALYFPTTSIVYSGGSLAQYTIIVSDSLQLGGSATINSNYSSLAGGSPIKGAGSVLVE